MKTIPIISDDDIVNYEIPYSGIRVASLEITDPNAFVRYDTPRGNPVPLIEAEKIVRPFKKLYITAKNHYKYFGQKLSLLLLIIEPGEDVDVNTNYKEVAATTIRMMDDLKRLSGKQPNLYKVLPIDTSNVTTISISNFIFADKFENFNPYYVSLSSIQILTPTDAKWTLTAYRYPTTYEWLKYAQQLVAGDPTVIDMLKGDPIDGSLLNQAGTSFDFDSIRYDITITQTGTTPLTVIVFGNADLDPNNYYIEQRGW